MLLVTYKLYFLEMPFAYMSVWVCKYVSICHSFTCLFACPCTLRDCHLLTTVSWLGITTAASQ